jgi:3-isopropylmalate/(R)-2-methylmalate dehydratase large subunit
MTKEQKAQGLLSRADGLAVTQREFARAQGIRLYDERPDGGSEAICHNAVLEDLAMPADLVVGTDSHTCMGGAVGCFSFGVGSTDMANAWFTRDVRVKVPHSVRIELTGQLSGDVSAKDLMIFLMAGEYFRQGRAIGQVLEYCGSGVASLGMDERATLTNMAVEAGAFTAIIAADDVVVEYIREMRGTPKVAFDGLLLRSDDDAEYAHHIRIDLAEVGPMVATPGDPRNGVPIGELEGDIAIDIAYGGSCTGGKMTDMDLYARVLSQAVEAGKSVHPDVELFLQFGSQRIKAYARQKGYIDLFERVGATLVNPSCGACINSGPGVSYRPDQVTVSAQNRNYPGRSGPGQVYLASPLVVAASAIAGRIVRPSEIF